MVRRTLVIFCETIFYEQEKAILLAMLYGKEKLSADF